MPAVRVSGARLLERRAVVVREYSERFPARADGEDPPFMPMLSPDEMRLASQTAYVVQDAPGVFAFDWSLVQRSIGRPLSALDQRVLRESAVGAAMNAVDGRLAALAASIDAATA